MLRLTIFLVIIAFAIPTKGLNSRKLDETTPPDLDNKCGGCPCNTNPCPQALPPPPPPPPPPAAPKPPSNYCPPPPGGSYSKPSGSTPPSQYVYVTGPPGNLYPVDPYHHYAGATRGFTLVLPLVMGCLLVGVGTFWW